MGISDFSSLPPHIKAILDALRDENHPAYIVGGAVRDLLRGAVPGDYDIATAAKPENVIAIARQKGWQVVDKLGHNFGVVLVVVDGHKAEVATFRGERYGSDSHRPAQVWYADTIEDDLSRRDFTINAMALAPDHIVIDPYGGQSDIKAGLIRAVGDSQLRFAEDGLRLFRACRFAAQLDFSVEEKTLAAISSQLGRAEGLAVERVREELQKLITAPAAHRGVALLVDTGLARASCRVREKGQCRSVPILPELVAGQGKILPYVPPDAALRWAALFLAAPAKGQGCSLEEAEEALARLGAAPPLIRRVVWLMTQHRIFQVYCHEKGNKAGLEDWLRSQARCGSFRYNRELTEGVDGLLALIRADLTARSEDEIDEGKPAKTANPLASFETFAATLQAEARDMPVHTSDIAYEAEQLMAALGGRDQMGAFLTAMLRQIQDRSQPNNRDAVLAAAREWRSGRKEIFPAAPND